MGRTGTITICAERLSSALARIEGLGCTVLLARPVSAGKYRFDVRLPTLEAGNAVAYAAARRELEWCQAQQFASVAS
jgi:hypothetical protein